MNLRAPEMGARRMHILVTTARNGDYYFTLLGPNHQVLSTSELYASKATCLEAIDAFRRARHVPPEAEIRYNSCFISYAADDAAFVQKLTDCLESNSITTWFAPSDLDLGAKTRTAIDQAVAEHDRVIIVISQYSISSRWAKLEVEATLQRERVLQRSILLPVTIDSTIRTAAFGWVAELRLTNTIVDFTNWGFEPRFDAAFARLLAAVRR